MKDTLLGIVTEVKALQPENAYDSIFVIVFGISIVVKPLQGKNALNIENQRFTF
jgi:hypothetical protein